VLAVLAVSAFLLTMGVMTVLAAVATAARRASRWVLLLALAGEITVGGAGLATGAWPLTTAAWATGAYLAVQWLRLERKAGRR